jgi:hypothetical protein
MGRFDGRSLRDSRLAQVTMPGEMMNIEITPAFLHFVFQNRFAMIAVLLEHPHRGNIRGQH